VPDELRAGDDRGGRARGGLIDVATHDVDLAAREALGDLAAESAAGSGDDGDLHAAGLPRQRTNR